MSFLNVEIKAKYNDAAFMRNYLLQNEAVFKGVDNQTDTYFNVHKGRLKLREGNIENNLIYYERTNQSGPKDSYFELLPVTNPAGMKDILSKSLGIKVVVQKKREIYFISNVKFHIDEVAGLGNFAEIEASNMYVHLTKEKLQQQCDFYMQELQIKSEDLISISYSDMLMGK